MVICVILLYVGQVQFNQMKSGREFVIAVSASLALGQLLMPVSCLCWFIEACKVVFDRREWSN